MTYEGWWSIASRQDKSSRNFVHRYSAFESRSGAPWAVR